MENMFNKDFNGSKTAGPEKNDPETIEGVENIGLDE